MRRVFHQLRKRIEVARVREGVEVDHADAAGDRLEHEIAADEAGSAGYKPGWHAGTPWDIGWARGNCRQTRRCRNAARKAREPPRAGDPRPAIAGRTVDCRTVATAAQRRWSPPLANRPARAGRQIGRAHVCTPVPTAHHVCSLLIEY